MFKNKTYMNIIGYIPPLATSAKVYPPAEEAVSPSFTSYYLMHLTQMDLLVIRDLYQF